jgi:hypothetical protein
MFQSRAPLSPSLATADSLLESSRALCYHAASATQEALLKGSNPTSTASCSHLWILSNRSGLTIRTQAPVAVRRLWHDWLRSSADLSSMQLCRTSRILRMDLRSSVVLVVFSEDPALHKWPVDGVDAEARSASRCCEEESAEAGSSAPQLHRAAQRHILACGMPTWCHSLRSKGTSAVDMILHLTIVLIAQYAT